MPPKRTPSPYDELLAQGGSPGGATLSPAEPVAQAPPPVQQAAPPQQPEQPQQSYSSGYVPWGNILNANQDESKKRSDKMAAGLESKAKAVREQLAAQKQAFGGKVNAGNPAGAPTQVQPESPGLPKTNAFGQPTSSPRAAQPAAMPVQSAQPVLQSVPSGAQSYSGPDALSEGEGWDELLRSGGEAQGRVGVAQDDSGLEALLREDASGPYTQGQSGLDAALMGATGRGRFAQLQKEYGGLLGELKDADKASRAESDAAKATVAKSNAEAARIAGERAAKLEADGAPGRAKAAEDAAYAQEREGKKAFDEYMTGNEVAHTVQDIGNALDPTAWALHAAGKKSIEDARAPEYEKQLGHPIGNSQAVRFERLVPGLSRDQQRGLYESLTTKELQAMEQMSPGEQKDFAWARWKEVYAKAKAKMEGMGFGKKSSAQYEAERVAQENARAPTKVR